MINKSEIIKEYNRIQGLNYCSHPESPTNCNGKIIKSHSIQKSNVLSKISKNGHVKKFKHKQLFKNSLFDVSDIGINEASTFKGFCNFHDTLVFKLIETPPLIINEETAFLFAYRAICERLFTKKLEKNLIPLKRKILNSKKEDLENIANKPKAIKDLLFLNEEALILNLHDINIKQKEIYIYEKGVDFGLRDLNSYKSDYDNSLLSNNFKDVKFFALTFDNVPDIMCSFALYPEIDFKGKKLQDFNDQNRLDLLTFTITATDFGGCAIFSWLGDSNLNLEFLSSLREIESKKVASSLIDFTFEFSENVYFSEDWYENLSKNNKESIKKRATSGTNLKNYRENSSLNKIYSKIEWNNITELTNLTF